MPHVVLMPSPGMGHLIPLSEFAKKLVRTHNFSATIIVPTSGLPSSAVKSVLNNLPSEIKHVILPPATFEDINFHDLRAETLISLTVLRSIPSIRQALRDLTAATCVSALIVDLFGTDVFDAADEFGLPNYIFYPSTATALSLFFYLPELDLAVSQEFRDMSEPVRIPGCLPMAGSELLDPVQDRKNEAYRWVLHHAMRYKLAEGIMVNSFTGMESGAIGALRDRGVALHPIGPLVKCDGSGGKDDPCLKWLDMQPAGSVLFVSFGSGGSLSSVQMEELAMGLEMSRQRFLWVARSPNSVKANATYFGVEKEGDPSEFLPESFVGRMEGKGMVVSAWAPQAEVLAHAATGGFLTHCGWNSTLESVVYGVPLIAWPLYAEQKMNAVVLTEDLKVAMRPFTDKDGMVSRVEVVRVVTGLMEGEEGKRVRSRMSDLKVAAEAVLSKNGSSTLCLAELARKWETSCQKSSLLTK